MLNSIKVDGTSVRIKKFNIESTITTGELPFPPRGSVLAVLKDGTILLGGGERGGSIFSWNEHEQRVKHIGDMISDDERIKADSRF